MRRYKVASTSEANLVVALQQMRPKRPMERERRRGYNKENERKRTKIANEMDNERLNNRTKSDKSQE